MKLISKNKELAKTLSSLIKRHESISLAVAWASAATDVFDALHEHADRIHRAIIGTHFYQTHPDVLRASGSGLAFFPTCKRKSYTKRKKARLDPEPVENKSP